MDLDVLLARILDFCQKGSRPDCQKTALMIFFSPQFKHFYSGLSMFYLIEIIIFQISEGVQHFYFFLGGGGPTFSRGVRGPGQSDKKKL